jgi:multidrug efflux pump subunit AcrA (membrane-fusion protein)
MAQEIRLIQEQRMKYRLFIVLLVAVLLAACSAVGQNTPTPLPTIAADTNSATPSAGSPSNLGGVTASGNIAAAQEAKMAFPTGGIVESVNVAVGDPVTAGQVLVKLTGSEELAAAVESAKMELLSAQQELLNAQQARQDLEDNLPQAQTDALQALNDARQALNDAQRKAAGLRVTASDADLNEAQATLILTQDKLDKARKDYVEVQNDSEKNLTRAALLNKYAQAQRDYDNALRRYNNLTKGSTDFYNNQTLTELKIAQERLDQAQKDNDTLQKGPRPEDVAAADKRVETAQGRITAADAAIKSAQAALTDLELKAPFAGVVGKLDAHDGEWVVPGQAVLELADLGHLRVETTDLSERDVPKITVGQPVTVFVKALNQNVSGRVSEIAPLADTIGGDVVYKATIDLDSLPEGLREGMSVDVTFGGA